MITGIIGFFFGMLTMLVLIILVILAAEKDKPWSKEDV